MPYYRRVTPDPLLVKGAVYEGKAGEVEKKAGLILIDDVPWREEDFIFWEPMAGDYVIAFATPEDSGVGIVSRVTDKSVFVKFKYLSACEYEVKMYAPVTGRAPEKQEAKETAPKEYPFCEVCGLKHDPIEKCEYTSLVNRISLLRDALKQSIEQRTMRLAPFVLL